MKIQIEVNEDHLRLMISALDFYSRIGIGQFNHIKDHPTFERHLYNECRPKTDPVVGDRTPQGEILEIKDGKALIAGSVKDGMWCKDHEWKPLKEVKLSTDYSKYHKIRERIDSELHFVRNMLYNENIPMNGSWGIYHNNVDESCRESFDLLQIFRHELWKNNPDRSSITVDSHIHFSSKDKSMNEVKIKTLKDSDVGQNNAYRLKHIQTGLYYQPNTGLSKRGKVYQSKSNALNYFSGETVTISIDVTKKQFKPFLDYFERHSYGRGHRSNTYMLPKGDFIKELINNG